MEGYITYESARDSQAQRLAVAIDMLSAAVTAETDAGAYRGPGPIFLAIGASLAAAAPAVWDLRSRGIDSWRAAAGDHPLPFATSGRPVVVISQSGRSTETLAALESIPADLRYAVVNQVPSPIADAASHVLSLGRIPDSYASTIGYTATVAALGMIGDVWDGGSVDAGWAELPELFRRVEQSVLPREQELAELFRDAPYADFVGTGPAIGSAEAGALLLREVARVPTTAMSTRQYLHGQMESAGSGVHVLFGDGRELETARTLAGAGHRVLLLTSLDVREAGVTTVTLPATPSAQRAVLEALVMQVLAHGVAALRGVEIEEFVFHNADTKVGSGTPSA
jgi:fructoselysine-6-P-deglycase FrlB-like protein